MAVPEPTSDERELLLRFLAWKRDHVIRNAEGLSEEQLRWTPDGKLVPIIGVINHLPHVEWRWINGRYLKDPFPPREEEWVVGSDLTGPEAIARYRARAEVTEEIVRAAPSLDGPLLGREGEGPPLHEMFGVDGPLSLRWAMLHLIEETAHHAGHADATRELLDGKSHSG